MASYVSHVTVVDGSSSAEARGRCPTGYTLVPVDLNEGAGGRWIYLCFAQNNDADPIVAMALSFSRTTDPTWWGFGQPVDLDLNKGAGGNYIYLFCLTSSAVKTARTTGSAMFNSPWTQWYLRGNPIIDIAAKSGSSRPATPSGYLRVEGYDAANRTTVDPDINRGAGGKYIYLYYKRTPALVSNSP